MREEPRMKANPKLNESLWDAARTGDAESVLALMYAGANPYWKKDESFFGPYRNAIEIAVKYSHSEVVKVITDVITQGIYDYE